MVNYYNYNYYNSKAYLLKVRKLIMQDHSRKFVNRSLWNHANCTSLTENWRAQGRKGEGLETLLAIPGFLLGAE